MVSSARMPEKRGSIATWPRLTGTYRDNSNGFYIHINQAGPHLELMVAFMESGTSPTQHPYPDDSWRTKTRVVRMGAQRIDEPLRIFELYIEPEGGPVDDDTRRCGTLQLLDHPTDQDRYRLQIALALDDVKGQYDSTKLSKLSAISKAYADRVSTRPTLFEHHIGDARISWSLRTQLWFPITPAQIKRLPSHAYGSRVKRDGVNYGRGSKAFGYIDLIRAYFTVVDDDELSEGTADARCKNIAEALDLLVGRMYSDAKVPTATAGGIDDYYLPYWRSAILTFLHEEQLVAKGDQKPKSLLEHTQFIIEQTESFVKFDNFATLLAVGPASETHYYEVVIEVINFDGGVFGQVMNFLARKFRKLKKSVVGKIVKKLMYAFPGGGVVGAVKITKLEPPNINPDPQRTPEWEAEYLLTLGGLKSGAGYGGGANEVMGTGHAWSYYGGAWKPHRLHGEANLSELSGSISGAGEGKGYGVGNLTLHGSGSSKPPPLHFNMTGFSDVRGLFPDASYSMVGYGGKLWYLEALIEDVDQMYTPPKDQAFEYGFHAPTEPLHFNINEARLRAEAKHILQVFAACELPLLSREGVELTIEGSADQPGNELENKLLSRNRAVSLFVYLKNLLEGDLAVGELKAIPEDEKEEIKEIIEKRKHDPKAPIFVPSNDNVTIIALGEPQSSEGGEKLYDQRYRRAQMNVDSIVALSLRRMRDT